MTQDQKSFNDAMQEWRAQQSLMARLFHGYFHLPGDRGVVGKLFGLLWRLLLPAAIAWIVFCIMVAFHLNGSGFRDSLKEELGSYFHAAEDTVEIEELNWSGGALMMRALEMEGGTGSFYTRLEARNVSIIKDYSMLWPLPLVGDAPWEFGDISASKIILKLKSGYEDSSGESAGLPSAESGPRRAGFGVDPDLSRATFKRIVVTSATFQWGHSDTTRGSISDTSFEGEKDADGTWHFSMTGGKLSQSWLRNLEVISLKIQFKGDTILFEEAKLKIGNDDVRMEGQITLGVLPALDLALHFEGVNAQPLIPEAFANAFGGTLTGKLQVGGSINSPDGVTTKADFTLGQESFVKTPAAFMEFRNAFQQPGLHPMYLKRGSIQFRTERGTLFIEEMDLVSLGESAKVTGGFEINKGSVGEGGKREEESFYGEIDLGLDPQVLGEHPELADKHFDEEEGEFRWMKGIELRGTLKELTRELSNSLAEEIRGAGGR